MSRMYTVEFSGVNLASGTCDFFEIAPAANKPCILHALFLSQSTEIKEAEEEMLRLQIIRGHTTSGSPNTPAPTARPMNPNNTIAAAFAPEAMNTTIASAGTPVNLHSENWNVRIPYQLIWTPEMRPIGNNGSGLIVVRLLAAIADAITFAGTLYVEEL